MQLVAVQEDVARGKLAAVAGLFGLAVFVAVVANHAPLDYVRAMLWSVRGSGRREYGVAVPCASGETAAVGPLRLHSAHCSEQTMWCASSLATVAGAAQRVHSPYALEGLAVRVVLYGRLWPADLGDALASPMLTALSAAHSVRVTVERRDVALPLERAEDLYNSLRHDVPAMADSLVLAAVHSAGHDFDAHWAPGWGGMCVVGTFAELPRCVATALDAPLRLLTNAADVADADLGIGLALSAISMRVARAERLTSYTLDRLCVPSLQPPVSRGVFAALRRAKLALDDLSTVNDLMAAVLLSQNAYVHARDANTDASHVPEQGVSREQAIGVLLPLLMPLFLPIAVALLSLRSSR